jgi:hypothetical protein
MNAILNPDEQQELRRFLNHPECVIGCTKQGNEQRRKVLLRLKEKGFITFVTQKSDIEYYQLKLEA